MPQATEADIVVRAIDGEPLAVVEVKNRQHLSTDVATALRRNLVVHGLLTRSRYFLLVSQDVGFLWDQGAEVAIDAPPALQFAMDRVVDRYLPRLSANERLQRSVLELVVLQWLSDLSEGPPEPIDEPERALAAVGLLEAIKGARISDAVAA